MARKLRWGRVAAFFIMAFAVVSVFMIFGASSKKDTLTLATTTSTYDSGLLDYLLPDFQGRYGVEVRVLSLGTGEAVKYGERGDADVILVHAPELEKKFVSDGFGIERKCVMYNDFVVIGPVDDPADVKGAASAAEAFSRIATSKSESPFVSRGDNSGTHNKEKKIWNMTGISPYGNWYMDAGVGMGDVIRIANDQSAYTLSDRGTYLSFKDKVGLVVLYEGGKELLNPYGVIAVNPKKYPHVKYAAAAKFVDWMMSPRIQEKIGNFTKNGGVLFWPLNGDCVKAGG